jgi:aminopeptidase N
MLGEVARTKKYSTLSTEEFREIAAKYLPPKSEDPKLENFFEAWVYNTGIPVFRIQGSVQGKPPKLRVRGTVTQSDVPEDFTASVPVEVTVAGRKVRQWVLTSGESTQFTMDVTGTAVKVAPDALGSVLSRR